MKKIWAFYLRSLYRRRRFFVCLILVLGLVLEARLLRPSLSHSAHLLYNPRGFFPKVFRRVAFLDIFLSIFLRISNSFATSVRENNKNNSESCFEKRRACMVSELTAFQKWKNWAKKNPGGEAPGCIPGGPGATNRLLTATNDLSSILGVWRAHHVWCGHMRERELVGARYGVGLLTEY